MKNQITEKFLCTYQDEAQGAKPISLTVKCENLNLKLSSNYFVTQAINILLSLDERNRILGVQLGDQIGVSLQSLKIGMEISPLGLFPAHVLQLDSDFTAENGGIIRFGYLKKIFSLKTFGLTVKCLLQKMFKNLPIFKQKNKLDLVDYWRRQHGDKNWGQYEALVIKDRIGLWQLYPLSEFTTAKLPALGLVAQFKVNQFGVVLGIEKMYAMGSLPQFVPQSLPSSSQKEENSYRPN